MICRSPNRKFSPLQLYSRADSWLGWGESRENDKVLRSLGHIFKISMRGLMATVLTLFGRDDLAARRKSNPLSIVPSGMILLLAGLLILGAPTTRAQSPLLAPHSAGAASTANPASPANSTNPTNSNNPANPANTANPAVLPGQYHDSFTLADAGSTQIELHSTDRRHNIYFTLPQSHVARTATIHVYYAFSPVADSAIKPSQAHPERNALRHHPAHRGKIRRLRRQRHRGRLQHSS